MCYVYMYVHMYSHEVNEALYVPPSFIPFPSQRYQEVPATPLVSVQVLQDEKETWGDMQVGVTCGGVVGVAGREVVGVAGHVAVRSLSFVRRELLQLHCSCSTRYSVR